MEAKNTEVESENQEVSESPSGLKIFWREIVRDKLALVSLIFLILITEFVYGISLFMNKDEIVKVDLFAIHEPPLEELWLCMAYGRSYEVRRVIIVNSHSMSV